MASEAKSARRAVLIAGPTASGKSDMALRIAEQRGGVIVNADSMQVYSVLNVLTARPRTEDTERVPHCLYGHVEPQKRYSTGAWLADVRQLLSRPRFTGQTIIFVGGTGLYFRALLGGLSDMPDIPERVRRRWHCRLAEEGPAKLHRVLGAADAEAATVIGPADGQRIVRALEVLEASGRSILHWRAVRGAAVVNPRTAERLIIEPDRSRLSAAIETRLKHMFLRGAVDEVARLLALALNDDLPAMKAIGVREIRDMLAGSVSDDETRRRMGTATRRYAKRQSTWFRNQCGPEWKRIPSGHEIRRSSTSGV